MLLADQLDFHFINLVIVGLIIELAISSKILIINKIAID